MDIANNGHGRFDVHDIALLHEELFCLSAYRLDDRLGQQFLLVEPCYALVEVDSSW